VTRSSALLLLSLTAWLGCDLATGLSDLRFDLPAGGNGPGGGGGAGGADYGVLCEVLTVDHWSGAGEHRPRGLAVDEGGVWVVGDNGGTLQIGSESLVANNGTDGFVVHRNDGGTTFAAGLGSQGDPGSLRAIAISDVAPIVTGTGRELDCVAYGNRGFVGLIDPETLALESCVTLDGIDQLAMHDVDLFGSTVWATGYSNSGIIVDPVNMTMEGPGPFVASFDLADKDLAMTAILTAGNAEGNGAEPGRSVVVAGGSDTPYVIAPGEGDRLFDAQIPDPPASNDQSVFVVTANPGQHTASAVARIGGDGRQWSNDAARSPDDAVVLGGGYHANIDFSGDAADVETPQPMATQVGGGFVARYGPGGNLVWRSLFDATSTDDEVQGVAVASDGTVFVTGAIGPDHSLSAIDCNEPLGLDLQLFVARLDADGELVWFRRFATTGAGRTRGSAIALSSDESRLWIAGQLDGTLELGSQTATSVEGADVILISLPSTL